MTKELKRLESILKKHEVNENKRAVVLVYLSVVMLGKKFGSVAKYFGVPEVKVETSVAILHQKLNDPKDRSFYLQMHEVMKEYLNKNQLKLVA